MANIDVELHELHQISEIRIIDRKNPHEKVEDH